MATEFGKLPDFLCENPEGTIRVSGMKLLFEGLAQQHREGETPEDMVSSYPHLDLDVARQIAEYCGRNREAVDLYLARMKREWEQDRIESEAFMASIGKEPLRVVRERRRREKKKMTDSRPADSFEKVAT